MHVSTKFVSRITLCCLTCLTFSIGSLQSAHAAWKITPTATGSYTCRSYEGENINTSEGALSNPDDLNNSGGYVYVSSDQYFPDGIERGQSINENLSVKFRLEWEDPYGNQSPIGLSNGNQIKVLIRVTGGVSASAKAYEYWNSGGEHVIGGGDATAWVTSSLGNAGPVTVHAAEGNLNPESSYAPLDVSTVRTLTVSGNVAETTVDLTRHSEVNSNFGEATASSGVSAIMSVAIVQLINPVSGGDPVYSGDNEYTFNVAYLGPNSELHFPYVTFPCITEVLQYQKSSGTGDIAGDISELCQPGKIDWSVDYAWGNALSRVYPHDSGTYNWIRPICADPFYPDQYFPQRGITFGQQDFMPTSINDFGPANISLLLSDEINLVGGNLAPAEVFFPPMDNHHPDPGHLQTPNWFYYYNQIYPAGDAQYTDGISYCDGSNVFVGNDAHGSWTLSVFIRDGNNMIVSGGVPRINDDVLWVRGIHNFIAALEHERAHKRHIQCGYVGDFDLAHDQDQDGVLDTFEDQIGLNKNMDDSTGAYYGIPDGSPDHGKGDRECIADIEALGKLLPQSGLASYDWANDGLQHGERNDTQFPWYYTLSANNTPCHAHLTVIP